MRKEKKKAAGVRFRRGGLKREKKAAVQSVWAEKRPGASPRGGPPICPMDDVSLVGHGHRPVSREQLWRKGSLLAPPSMHS